MSEVLVVDTPSKINKRVVSMLAGLSASFSSSDSVHMRTAPTPMRLNKRTGIVPITVIFPMLRSVKLCQKY